MDEKIKNLKLRTQVEYLNQIIERAERLKKYLDIEDYNGIKEVLKVINRVGGAKKYEFKGDEEEWQN